MDEKKIKELSEKIYSVCLLIATQGQTKEMIKNDIEMGLKYFKAITINVFVDNGTVVKREHFSRSENIPARLNTGYLDIINYYKRIADHTYNIIEYVMKI